MTKEKEDNEDRTERLKKKALAHLRGENKIKSHTRKLWKKLAEKEVSKNR